MPKRIINIFNGTNIHWYKSHNKLVEKYYSKSNSFPESNKIIIQIIIYSINEVLTLIVGPKRDKKIATVPISNKNIKTLTYKNFSQCYKELVTMYIILLSISDNNFKTKCENTYYDVYNDYLGYNDYCKFINPIYINPVDIVDEDTGEICNMVEIKKIDEKELPEIMKSIINNGFNQLTETINCVNKIDIGLRYIFTITTMTYLQKIIKPQLSKIIK